ncbi:MAG: alpha/beta hydrolase-fold protein [Pedobacter sp.]|uniref:alpha/beta hydrolase n=1 Tax=Pedobacter sp. TaxID=1411316 RepID=UPI002808E848|nr:alpha/beta hydrolase-fold protein [Pedobacter sp.]MDQ8006378.1 alpha/beta hydrolase-fold protein [Pedobacter sp.]
MKSKFLQRSVDVDIYVPENLLGNETVNLLLVNDGQDLAQMEIEQSLSSLYTKWKIEPVVVVGMKANEERLLEYGIAHRPDFKNRGSKAHLHTSFVINELLPFVKKETGININGKKAFAGFSLGGLTAFDIAWHNSAVFDLVGVFSGSFWWRKKDLSDGYTDDDRILHEMVRKTATKPDLKFWLMTGTEDEKADRNQNFIIDSIDDTIDVVKELVSKGYHRPSEVFYYEMVGGKHDVPTWGKAFPKFLEWAFGK